MVATPQLLSWGGGMEMSKAMYLIPGLPCVGQGLEVQGVQKVNNEEY